jgi:hypothetical protein
MHKARRLRMASTGGRATELVTKAWGLAMAQATEHSPARKWDLVMERGGQRILEQEQAEVMDVEAGDGSTKAQTGQKVGEKHEHNVDIGNTGWNASPGLSARYRRGAEIFSERWIEWKEAASERSR